MPHFVGFWAKTQRLGSSGSQIENFQVGFGIFGMLKQENLFLRSKNVPDTYEARNRTAYLVGNSLTAVLDYCIGLRYEYVLSPSFLNIYSTVRRFFPPNLQPTTCCRTRPRTALDLKCKYVLSTYFLDSYITTTGAHEVRQYTYPAIAVTLGVMLVRLFLWFRLLHGASRPSSSARLHLYYLFSL